MRMKHEMYRDYEQGMDIPCIASKYNLSCEEARDMLGVDEDEENDNEWHRKVWRNMSSIGRYRCYWEIYSRRYTFICL